MNPITQNSSLAQTQQCWLYPNGGYSIATANSTAPIYGAHLGTCPAKNSDIQRTPNDTPRVSASPPLQIGIDPTQEYRCWACYTNPKTGNKTGFHTGIDIRADIGTNVLAVRGGTVRWMPMGTEGPDNHRLGNVVILSADDGYFYLYAHLSSIVKQGRVEAGEVIAKSGNSGGVAPHLHLEKKTRPVLSDPTTGTRWGYTDNNNETQTPESLGYMPPL